MKMYILSEHLKVVYVTIRQNKVCVRKVFFYSVRLMLVFAEPNHHLVNFLKL